MLAFAFMDIQTATGYMRHGYRIRRASWTPKEVLVRAQGFIYHCHFIKASETTKYTITTSWTPDLPDLIADDWEIVLDGIASDYGAVKYEETK